eukprot:scaffold105433_cov31-Tisochrysis_lutea.AAC.11
MECQCLKQCERLAQLSARLLGRGEQREQVARQAGERQQHLRPEQPALQLGVEGMERTVAHLVERAIQLGAECFHPLSGPESNRGRESRAHQQASQPA